jgi:hypothetical protein
MQHAATPSTARTTTAEDTLQQKARDPNVISGGHLVARALKAEGVDTIFTLCGGHIIDIYDGCLDEGIRIVDVRHEQTAAHAADGYARQTGRLGCVVTTAGPGCTNAVTGIATAFRSESPVLHIGGQSALSQWKMGGLQDLAHVDLMKPITKFASTVVSTERVADMVSMAARECFAGAPGPSYLEIPRDVLDREIDIARAVIPKPYCYRASTRSAGDPRDIEKLADLLVNAERPAILFGQQVWMARGHEQAIALLRGLDIPGYFNGAARGVLPPGDPHHFDRTRSKAFDKADVIVVIGTPFDFRMGYGKRISRELTLVQIDLDYRTVGKNRDIDLGIVGDPGAVCAAVLQAASGRIKNDKRQARRAWMKDLALQEDAALEKLMPMFKSEQTPIHPIEWRTRSTSSHRRHDLHRRRRRRGDDLGAGRAAPRAGQLDGSGRPRLARRRHRLRARGQARASEEGSALLLRRWRLRHDGVRHGNRGSVRCALHCRHRQQLGDEPDPLRTDGQVRSRARQRRQQAWRHELLGVPADVGRLGRRGPRGIGNRAGAAQGARDGREERQVGGRQHLGRPERICAGHEESDDVQVTAPAG